MDLSPGMRMSPESPFEQWAVAGFGEKEWDIVFHCLIFGVFYAGIEESGASLAQE